MYQKVLDRFSWMILCSGSPARSRKYSLLRIILGWWWWLCCWWCDMWRYETKLVFNDVIFCSYEKERNLHRKTIYIFDNIMCISFLYVPHTLLLHFSRLICVLVYMIFKHTWVLQIDIFTRSALLRFYLVSYFV